MICFPTFFSQVRFPGTFDVVDIEKMIKSQATYQITKTDEKVEPKVQE